MNRRTYNEIRTSVPPQWFNTGVILLKFIELEHLSKYGLVHKTRFGRQIIIPDSTTDAVISDKQLNCSIHRNMPSTLFRLISELHIHVYSICQRMPFHANIISEGILSGL